MKIQAGKYRLNSTRCRRILRFLHYHQESQGTHAVAKVETDEKQVLIIEISRPDKWQIATLIVKNGDVDDDIKEYIRVIFIFSNPRKIKRFLGNKKDFNFTNANQ